MSKQENKIVPLSIMARRLHVPSKWLRAEAEAHRLPHIKADDSILFHPETVETILAERAKKGGARAN